MHPGLAAYLYVYLPTCLFHGCPSAAERCGGSDGGFLPTSASPDSPAGRRVPPRRCHEAPRLHRVPGGDKHEAARRHGFVTILSSAASDLRGCFGRTCLHSCLLWSGILLVLPGLGSIQHFGLNSQRSAKPRLPT